MCRPREQGLTATLLSYVRGITARREGDMFSISLRLGRPFHRGKVPP